VSEICPALPRGTHASGHDAAIVALLRWARSRECSFAASDLGEDARLTLDALVLNRYVACADARPIPRGWRLCVFVISAAGLDVLARADAAEPAPARPEPSARAA
jgi:hypothetical protein